MAELNGEQLAQASYEHHSLDSRSLGWPGNLAGFDPGQH